MSKFLILIWYYDTHKSKLSMFLKGWGNRSKKESFIGQQGQNYLPCDMEGTALCLKVRGRLGSHWKVLIILHRLKFSTTTKFRLRFYGALPINGKSRSHALYFRLFSDLRNAFLRRSDVRRARRENQSSAANFPIRALQYRIVLLVQRPHGNAKFKTGHFRGISRPTDYPHGSRFLHIFVIGQLSFHHSVTNSQNSQIGIRMNTLWKGLPFTFPRFGQFAVGCACAAKCIGCDSVGEVFWWCCGYWSHPGELRICSKWQLHSTLTISLHLVGYWKWWVLPLKGWLFWSIRDIFGCYGIFMWIYKYPENPVASWTEQIPISHTK